MRDRGKDRGRDEDKGRDRDKERGRGEGRSIGTLGKGRGEGKDNKPQVDSRYIVGATHVLDNHKVGPTPRRPS